MSQAACALCALDRLSEVVSIAMPILQRRKLRYREGTSTLGRTDREHRGVSPRH